MLKGLTLKFNVAGNGIRALKKMKQSYNEVSNRLRKPLKANFNNIKNPFVKVSNGIDNISEKAYRLKMIFKGVFYSIKNVGVNAFKKITSSFNRFINQFRLTRALKKGFQRFSKYSTKVFEKAQNKANTLASTFKRLMGILGAGITIKTAFEGASKMEQYRNTLETVLKDSKLAQKKLAWASRLANRTPFETEEVVGGMTKLQSYGMEGDRVLKSTGRTYIEMIGDMASAMDKPFEQAVEALADSRTGELERLKEFGITKDMIGDFGKQKGYGELFNNKGQIKDLQLFNKALFELMNSKFGGAMEKQSKTFKGAISTIRGVTKSALATFAGIDEFGNIIKNSPFQIIKDKVLIPLANILIKYQEDGTFTKWAEELATAMSNVLDLGIKVFKFLKKWKEVIIPLTSALAGLFIINKVAYAIGALKVAIAALSFNPILLGVGLVIAVGVALYRNWAKITKFFKNIFKNIINFYQKLQKMAGFFSFLIPGQAIFEVIKSFWSVWDSNFSIIENLKNGFKNLFKMILNKFKPVIRIFKNFGKVISNSIRWVVNKITSFFNWIIKGLSNLWNTVSEYSGIFTFLIPGAFIFEAIKSFWSVWDSNFSIIDNLKNGFESFFSFLSNKIEGAINGFKKLGEKIANLSIIKKAKSLFSFKDKEENNKKEPQEKIKINGSHRMGLSYVPQDDYIAKLHVGERVLTREENKNYSNKVNTGGNTYNLNITINNSSSNNIDYRKIGEMIIDKIRKYEEEKEVALGLI